VTLTVSDRLMACLSNDVSPVLPGAVLSPVLGGLIIRKELNRHATQSRTGQPTTSPQ